MIEMIFEQTAPTGGDCTAPYDVYVNPNCTVEQFINAVLARRERGYIDVKGFGFIEYSGNRITNNQMDPNALHREVAGPIKAGGGWSQMSYSLRVKS